LSVVNTLHKPDTSTFIDNLSSLSTKDITKNNETTNILIIGSNFLASSLLLRLTGFNNVNITVVDRKDVTTIVNYNNECYHMFRKYCSDLTYRKLLTSGSRKYGDPQRNMFMSFRFVDFVTEDIFSTGIPIPDIIFHCGSVYDRLYAENNPRETLNINVFGTLNIIKSLQKAVESQGIDTNFKVPLFIHFSSINVYGDQKTGQVVQKNMIDETATPNPQDMLNYSLYSEEKLIQTMGHNVPYNYLILRLGNLIGYFTPTQSLVNQAVTALLTQQPEFEINNPNESIELLSIDDFVDVINSIMAINKDVLERKKLFNQIINVKTEEPEPKTVMSVVNSIYQMVGKLPKVNDVKLRAPSIVTGPSHRKDIQYPSISCQKSKDMLGYVSRRPIIFSLVTNTASWLLKYVIPDLSQDYTDTLTKIFYIPSTPIPERALKQGVDEDLVEKTLRSPLDQIKDI
jgi:nucleoside-diphosphate-sugar epimerase